MYSEFSIAQTPAASSVTLKELWVVKADPCYDVYKGEIVKQELIAVRTVNGQGMLFAEGMEPFCLEAGTLLLVELRKIKRYCCSSKHWDFWWFEFYTSEMPDLFLHKIFLSPYLEREEDKVMHCMKLLRNDDRLSQRLASSSFSVLLYSWLKDSGTSFSSSLPYEKEIRETASYMQANLSGKISISGLAQRVGVCDKHFRELFKTIYYMPPKKYFDQLRIQAAQALLLNTNLTICEISERLGFFSSFHFTREFKKHCYKTPTAFRKAK